MGSQEGDDFSSAFPRPLFKYKQMGEGCKYLQLQKQLQFLPTMAAMRCKLCDRSGQLGLIQLLIYLADTVLSSQN